AWMTNPSRSPYSSEDAGRCERLVTRGSGAVSKATFAPARAVKNLLAGQRYPASGPRNGLDPVTSFWCALARKKSTLAPSGERQLRGASVREAVEVSVSARRDEILLRAGFR